MSMMLLPVSARDESALHAQAGRWSRWLKDDLGSPARARWVDVVHTAALRRKHFPARAAIVSDGIEPAAEALLALEQGVPHPSVFTGEAQERGKVAFIFPGQGSQWLGMGRELLRESSVFAETVEMCDAALQPLTGWSVVSVLRGDPDAPPLDRVDVVQPALFSMSVGLAAAWVHLGVEPAAVIGHSQGEIGAAYVAGALSLQDAALVVAARSRLLRQIAGTGAMAALEMPSPLVERRIERWNDRVSIAVINTSSSTVVSGDPDRVEELVAELKAEGVFCRMINVDYASHSRHVDAVLPALLKELVRIRPQPTHTTIFSTVTGAPLDGDRLDAAYWCRNLREPVRFHRALARVQESGHDVFVEVSPHPVLTVPLATASPDALIVGSLEREKGTLGHLLAQLATLHVEGLSLNWRRILESLGGGRLVNLPTYAFTREPHWIAPREDDSEIEVGLLLDVRPSVRAPTPTSEGLNICGRKVPRQIAPPGAEAARLAPSTGLKTLSLESLVQVVAPVLGLKATRLDVNRRLSEYGLTSIMAFELTKRLQKNFGIKLVPRDLLIKIPTMTELHERLKTMKVATMKVATKNEPQAPVQQQQVADDQQEEGRL